MDENATGVVALPDLAVVRSMLVPARADAGAGGDELGLMTVRFARFETWYEINSWWEGRFLERTVRGAFSKTIKERGPKGSGQIKTLFDHGFDFTIGDKILGAITDLREDDDSPVLEANLFDTSYNRDLLPGLRAGVYGSSFMFRVLKEDWVNEPPKSDHNPDGLPERTVREVKLYEAGPVTWPANPDATAEMDSYTPAGAIRSGTDWYYERLSRRDGQLVAGLRTRLTELRTSRQQAAAQGTASGGEAASHHGDEPTARHSSSALTRAARARKLREFAMGGFASTRE